MSRTLLLPFLAALFLASCGIAPPPAERARIELRGDSLAAADVLLERGGRIKGDKNAATVYRLRAAEIAWRTLDTDGGSVGDVDSLGTDQLRALRILTTATEGVAENFVGPDYAPRKTFSYGGFRYTVSAGIDQKPGLYPLADIESAKLARDVRRTLVEHWYTEDGVGVPIAPKWKKPSDPRMDRFVVSRGYVEPITAVLAFDGGKAAGGGRSVSLTGYDPTYVSRIELGKTEYPLAADFTAPIVEQSNDINELTVALTGLIHPGVIDSKLILLEPWDPQRIPVLLVHGLNSHPRMWRDVVNDLRADPLLRGRYQFMLFYYPTGWPIAYSALRLREELTALDELVRDPKPMVVIGHSMGGLLARMQVISPGRKLWDAELGTHASTLFTKLPSDNLVKRTTFFEANPDIGREIFISTPQRGSGLADLSLTSLFIRVLKLPTKITSAFIDLPGNIFQRGQLTSVAGLSPANPLYKALDEIPIQVPYHSIIGDRGCGNTPNSSDGVVPYWSSHLAGAQSELIVPSNHGAYDDPQAILEMRRILLLNAGIPYQAPATPLPPAATVRDARQGFAIDTVRKDPIPHIR